MATLARRLLPVLQLTRMALVFTAIADSITTLLLRERLRHGLHPDAWGVWLPPERAVEIAVISAGLYGFGVSLNDIIDRRRDEQLASHRPLPSGQLGVRAAHVVCALLAAISLAAGALYGMTDGGDPFSLLLVIWTGILITFFDFAGKYLVAPGLLTMGLVRFFHAAIPSPSLPLLWHPLLLLNHVAIVSTVAYGWEQKRPNLTRGHWRTVIGGLALMDAILIVVFYLRRKRTAGVDWSTFQQVTWITPGLLLPLAAAGLFVLVAFVIARTSATYRDAGQRLLLAGLLWLIVYDAAFAAAYVTWPWAGALLLLLPVAYASVKVLAWWGQLASLSRRPEFRRARV